MASCDRSPSTFAVKWLKHLKVSVMCNDHMWGRAHSKNEATNQAIVLAGLPTSIFWGLSTYRCGDGVVRDDERDSLNTGDCASMRVPINRRNMIGGVRQSG